MLKRLARGAFAALLALAPLSALAASNLYIPTVGPHSMADLSANYINPALLAVAGCSSGTVAPTNGPGAAPILGECWLNTSSNPYALEIWDGAAWNVALTINATSHAIGLPAASITGSALPSGITSAPGLSSFGPTVSANQYLGSTTTAASVSSGGTLASSNGTFETIVTVSGTPSAIVLNLPTAIGGWDCTGNDETTVSTSNFVIKQYPHASQTTSSVTMSVFNDVAVAGALTNGDTVKIKCNAY